MKFEATRRQLLALLASFAQWCTNSARSQEKKRNGNGGGQGAGGTQKHGGYALPADLADYASCSIVMGRISDRAVTLSALAPEPLEGYYEYGTRPSAYKKRTEAMRLEAGAPFETIIEGLRPDTQYHYRFRYRKPGETRFAGRTECRFHTCRKPGSTFTFAVQGDSHPERPQMSHPDLYAKTLQHAAATAPDFYLCMGDDFSISTLHSIDPESVNGRYTLQRPFLGLIGQTAPIFLLNGNHEQASLFNYKQADERHQAAILAQNARNRYFPTIEPNEFYTGNRMPLKEIGALKDYYAWSWGDALFIVLDNYWHSTEQVDSGLNDRGGNGRGGGGRGKRDLWGVSLGEEQYQWFKRTLEVSRSKYKFVFAHHVLGTQRGGVDVCHLYEWGGHDRSGEFRFKEMRPGWDLPIHDLMVKHGVTIFFQGHDHLFCKQEKDGVIYQEVPMPADHSYMMYNEDRYGSGVKLPNSGYLKVSVSTLEVKVEYVRCYLPADESNSRHSGEIAHSYTVKPRAVG